MAGTGGSLPEDLMEEIEALAGDLGTDWSRMLRRTLCRGIRALRVEAAVTAYAREEITLERAAERAGVSLQQLASAAADRGIARFRYDANELDRDIEEATSFLEDE